MSPEREKIADNAFGWLLDGEGEYLHELAIVSQRPILEVGAYCGKSTVWLGDAAEQTGNIVYSVDHHLGSGEMQPGAPNHNPDVIGDVGPHDTLRHWRRTILEAGLEQTVVGVVAPSTVAARFWTIPLGLVFIDADHSYEGCLADFEAWSPYATTIAFHDTTIAGVQRVVAHAIEQGWELAGESGTIRVVRR